MIELNIETGKIQVPIYQSEIPLSVGEIWKCVQQNGISRDQFYILYNGRIVADDILIPSGKMILTPKLFGGKGGFGSMLRSIGAQIEKTTNREACRDLSGRRLRDINKEKKLKEWAEKKAKMEEEAAERKKRKLEKLCIEPKHEFKDENYYKERSTLAERIEDAVEEGLKMTKNEKQELKPIRKTILDMEFDSDELDSSEESEVESPPKKMKKIEAKQD